MLKKYLKILWHFAKASLMQQMAYRPSFILAVIGKATRMAILLLFFHVIYFNTPLLAGWEYKQILLLVATYLTIESLIIITFHRNLAYYFPDLLRKGNFDFLLTKPVNTLFYTSLRVIDLMDLTSFLVPVGLWIYILASYSYEIGAVNLLLYLVLVINALIFLFAFLLLIASTAFWTINSTGLGRFFENIVRIARYPSDIFQGLARLIFLYIMPISVVTTLPVKSLLNIISWPHIIYAFVFTLVLLICALAFWKYALKHYSSASS